MLTKEMKRGIWKLRNYYGLDWPGRIDPNTLDMSHTKTCILGQLEGDYTNGLAELGIDGFGYDFGFEVSSSDGHNYGQLTQMWREYLESQSI